MEATKGMSGATYKAIAEFVRDHEKELGEGHRRYKEWIKSECESNPGVAARLQTGEDPLNHAAAIGIGSKLLPMEVQVTFMAVSIKERAKEDLAQQEREIDASSMSASEKDRARRLARTQVKARETLALKKMEEHMAMLHGR